ncbi:hypothetical protein FEF26_11445 [Nesterenkonia salmonea]|uniref:Uncharacterized protein n=1 Tax=Nesterenkonia salmonea TaxID=1804987 RepID=A0A5R9B8U6_9MICC|nr:hypothetical protein [Nesterenkonia salmonea]TLP94731.1 hypothetical protein FEF26_11445 [Nesterenkonia salmonea]
MDEDAGQRSRDTIAVVEDGDGVLLLGSEGKLSELDNHPELKPRRLSSFTLSRAGNVLGAVSGMQASSGRWLKLDGESSAFLLENGILNPQAGVVRAENGRILKHLKFENAALLTPAAPAALSALATQAALEAALDDIQRYLASIDAKLDRLLKQRKVEVLGQLGGVTLSIDEAHALYTRAGRISAVTWSKVQANSLQLQTMQAEAVAQLDALAENLRDRVGDIDGSAHVLADVREDAPFWLGVLARCVALQDRQYVIELARVADEEPDQLESHHDGIRTARADRAQRIGQRLKAIRESVEGCADLSNLDRVANPFTSQRITSGANSVNQTITEFAEHAALNLTGYDHLESVAWGSAAKAVIGDVGSKAGPAGGHVAKQAKGIGNRLQARREAALVSKLEKVQNKRKAALKKAETRKSGQDGLPE